jgi:hypothetical protein
MSKRQREVVCCFVDDGGERDVSSLLLQRLQDTVGGELRRLMLSFFNRTSHSGRGIHALAKLLGIDLTRVDKARENANANQDTLSPTIAQRWDSNSTNVFTCKFVGGRCYC